MKFTIKVSPQDIIDGIPEDERLCPIALACRRILPKNYDFFEVDDNLNFTDVNENRQYTCILPEVADDFIQTFDNHLPVYPIEFEIEPILD
jgi:hypothetical protein